MSLPRPIEKLNMLMRCLPDSPFKNRLAEEIVAYGQACREAALEEAAQICESQNQGWHSDDAALIAHQIRSLK